MPVQRRAAPLLLALAAALAACGGGGGSAPPATTLGTPELLWDRGGCLASFCQTGWYASPGVADLDGDGVKEIVWASYDTVALRPDGTLRWRSAGARRSFGSPVIADLAGDAKLEVAATRNDEVAWLDAAGALLNATSPFGADEVRSLAAGDVAGDARPELVVGRAGAGSTGQVSVLDASGAALAGWPARHDTDPGYGWGLYGQNLAVADLLGTGKAQVVAPSDVHYVMAFAGDGSQLPAHPRYGLDKVWNEIGLNQADAADLRGYTQCETERRFNFADGPASVADLDGDGVKEVVLVGNLYDCAGTYFSVARLPIVLKADRSRWAAGAWDWTVLPVPGAGAGPRSEDYAVIESVQSNPVLADLDGDGKKEILYASYDGRLHAYWLDKTEHGSWPWAVPGSGIRFATEPAVADLDGDGKAEVVVGTWTETASGQRGALAILDWQGRLLRQVTLPASFPAAGGTNGALGAPTLANLDAGPEVEVLLGTSHSGVVAYRIPGSVATGIRWGTGRGNLLRNGVAP